MFQSLERRLTDKEGHEDVVPLSLVKDHVIVQHDVDDEILKTYRDAAVAYVEDTTRRTLTLSEYRVGVEVMPSPMKFRLPPIRQVSGITYKNSNSDTIRADESCYNVELGYEAGWVKPLCGWPASACDIEFKVVAGYGYHANQSGYPYDYGTEYGISPGEVLPLPRPMMQAILLLVGHWYANREAVVMGGSSTVPHAVDALLGSYRNYLS